jgi:hypothetical protein
MAMEKLALELEREDIQAGNQTGMEVMDKAITYGKDVLSYIFGKSEDTTEYKAFKGLVREVLAGNELDMSGKEVPYEKLAQEGVWGKWQGKSYWVPRLGDVGKILKKTYKSAVSAAAKMGMSKKELEENVQEYIRVHEVIEAATKPKDHDAYESTLLRALGDLADEGDMVAYRAYHGALATYKERMSQNDSMVGKISQRYKRLKEDVAGMFGAEPEAVPAMA